jgi:hypothetical protein
MDINTEETKIMAFRNKICINNEIMRKLILIIIWDIIYPMKEKII